MTTVTYIYMFCITFANLTVRVIGYACLTSISTVFQLYRGGNFYCWGGVLFPIYLCGLWSSTRLSVTDYRHMVVSSTPGQGNIC